MRLSARIACISYACWYVIEVTERAIRTVLFGVFREQRMQQESVFGYVHEITAPTSRHVVQYPSSQVCRPIDDANVLVYGHLPL